MTIALISIAIGICFLLWSADRFVEGSANLAKHAGMPPLLIGMLIVGFGTSAPEMLVSALAAIDGNPELALGNAIGSNIINIGLILGITALIAPMTVQSTIIYREIPILFISGLVAGALFGNLSIERFDAAILLLGFTILMIWSIYSAQRAPNDPMSTDTEQELNSHSMTLRQSIIWVVLGLIVLLISSRVLVSNAVLIAEMLGMSELVIGLTIVALGTSLPELAASIIAARKQEHDIAIGNIVGSNLFNLLAVVGIAGMITPVENLAPDVLSRDWLTMMVLTTLLFIISFNWGRNGEKGQITRKEGGLLVLTFACYNIWLLNSVIF